MIGEGVPYSVRQSRREEKGRKGKHAGFVNDRSPKPLSMVSPSEGRAHEGDLVFPLYAVARAGRLRPARKESCNHATNARKRKERCPSGESPKQSVNPKLTNFGLAGKSPCQYSLGKSRKEKGKIRKRHNDHPLGPQPNNQGQMSYLLAQSRTGEKGKGGRNTGVVGLKARRKQQVNGARRESCFF